MSFSDMEGSFQSLDEGKIAQDKLQQVNFLVMRSQLRSDASPFLGLALNAEKLPEARQYLRQLSDWRLQSLLDKFGYAVSWAICAELSEHYGEDGNAKVWPLVEALLNRNLKSSDDRRVIHSNFIRTCRKMGLASEGFERPVQAFQIHAGVARSQLRHLARSFIAQEKSLGLPDQNDIVLLNRWEDDALHFLDAGIQVLQRPILMDHSAWMAAAYVDWRLDNNAFAGKTSYLEEFGEQLKAEFNGNGRTSWKVAPVPRLVWEDGRPQLSVPGQSQRFKIFLDGELHRVRAGRLWPLPYPLPGEISWDGERPGRILVFQEGDFSLFDSNTGRQVDTSVSAVRDQTQINGLVATAIIVARDNFLVDGQMAHEIGAGLFAANADLRSGPVTLTRGEKVWLLKGVRRPQISVKGQPIAKGLGVPNLWCSSAEIELDFGSSELLAGHTDGSRRSAFVRIEANNVATDVEVEVDGRGIATLTCGDLLGLTHIEDDEDPISVSITLLRSSAVSSQAIETRFKRRLSIWPGFQRQIGNILQAKSPPKNFIPSESKDISKDDSGNLCFDRSGGFFEARAAFGIGGQVMHFAVRPQILAAVLERIDGSVAPWKIGDALVTSNATRSDALVISSPDEGASLKIGGRVLGKVFREQPTYAIPIATLDGGDISHISSSGLPTLIATIESALEPATVDIRAWAGGTQIEVEMPFKVGGVKMNLETENSDRDTTEVSFDHLPTEARTQFWVKNPSAVENRFSIQLSGRMLPGLSLIEIRVRRAGETDWLQLTNARKDTYAFPLLGDGEEVNGFQQVAKLEGWLGRCYAREIWEHGLGELLLQRRAEVITCLKAKPGGIGRLMLLALDDEELDWLPLVHIIQEVPNLFAGPAIDFHVFSGSGGSERILRLISDSAATRLRELELSPEVLIAFPNARAASNAGEKLRDFKPQNLPIIFASVDKPAEWLGATALGADHAATALNLMRDRIETHEILGAGEAEGRMSLRSLNINRVASAMKNPDLANRCLAAENDDDASMRMIEKAIVAFAVSSRTSEQAVTALISRTAAAIGETETKVLAAVGEMLRLGRELFIFHLIAAEIEKRSKS